MTLFNTTPDTLDGFDAFWALYPRDDHHPGRKSGKAKCRAMWKSRGLWKVKHQIMAALKEDIKAISKGSFKRYKDGNPLECFPGVHPWLNQGKYDRDTPEPAKSKKEVKPEVVAPEHKVMTKEEFDRLKPRFRELARVIKP